MSDAIYYSVLGFAFCLSYAGIFFLFRFFFRDHSRMSERAIAAAAGTTLGFLVLTNIFYYIVPDHELQNRLLHAFGGGFLLFVVCFLVARDLATRIDRVRFFIFSFFIVTTLGVVNEIAELLLHLYFGMSYATNPLDTAFDLVSNTLGALLAAACVLPFYKRIK
ncbi:hypothetical protein EXS62_01345 [Candidatus Kaiserbacteria bacterium]|nr:hypothetical protein [Candidatus Kaiserbacteria bacterium]